MGVLILFLVLAGNLGHWWLMEEPRAGARATHWPILLVGGVLCALPYAILFR